MLRYFLAASLAVLLAFTLLACGSSSTPGSISNPPGATTVPVSISIHDTPPAGVTVLRFEVLITAATLQPSGMGQQPVNMLLQPQDVELIHLQTESAILGNLNVPTGTYSSLSATFANPLMTILNQSTTTYTVGAQSCQPGETCQVVPTLNQMSVTVSTAPFPITLTANSPVVLDMHFDVNASVQGDLSVTPMVSVKQLPVPPNAPFQHRHLFGTVTAVSAPTFTLQSSFDSMSYVITTDSNTMYRFGEECMADNFSCIMNGQLLKVDANEMAGGTLDATEVERIQMPGLPSFHGTILSVNASATPPTIQVGLDFEEVPIADNQQFMNTNSAVSFTVQITPSTQFSVDSDSLTLPAGLSFASVSDLIAGQSIQFQPTLSSLMVSGTPPNVVVTVAASSIQLEPSQVTASVSAVNAGASPPNFILNSLPMIYTHAGINQIQVDAVTGTDFDNVSGVSGLSSGQTVSVAGLLFNTATQPTMVAVDVRLRQDND